jgi:hypothetical protein
MISPRSVLVPPTSAVSAAVRSYVPQNNALACTPAAGPDWYVDRARVFATRVTVPSAVTTRSGCRNPLARRSSSALYSEVASFLCMYAFTTAAAVRLPSSATALTCVDNRVGTAPR